MPREASRKSVLRFSIRRWRPSSQPCHGVVSFMRVLADNAAAKLSRRMRAIPEQVRAISALVDPDRYPPVAHARRIRRLSTRHLMILVAAVGLFLGVLRVWQDVSFCQQEAAFHEDMAAFHRSQWPKNMNRSDAAALIAGMRRRPDLAVVHSRMKAKWEYAAAHPWFPVEADLPALTRTPLK
jgi:hypothetical protein